MTTQSCLSARESDATSSAVSVFPGGAASLEVRTLLVRFRLSHVWMRKVGTLSTGEIRKQLEAAKREALEAERRETLKSQPVGGCARLDEFVTQEYTRQAAPQTGCSAPGWRLIR